MKKIVLVMVFMMAIATSIQAMNLSNAKSEALFLTDKMAYELNLSDDQYNAAYELNLDYLLMVSSNEDISGQYWSRRNRELSYVLSTSQYNAFKAAAYFYHPISWNSNHFQFNIHNRYPQKRYYRSAPSVYRTYNGGNRHYQHSAYQGRTFCDNKERTPRQESDAKQQQPTMKRKEAIREGQNENRNENKENSRNNRNNSEQGSNRGQQQNNDNHSQNDF